MWFVHVSVGGFEWKCHASGCIVPALHALLIARAVLRSEFIKSGHCIGVCHAHLRRILVQSAVCHLQVATFNLGVTVGVGLQTRIVETTGALTLVLVYAVRGAHAVGEDFCARGPLLERALRHKRAVPRVGVVRVPAHDCAAGHAIHGVLESQSLDAQRDCTLVQAAAHLPVQVNIFFV